MVRRVDFVERAMESARSVLPVPGGPYSRIPLGGFSSVVLPRQHTCLIVEEQRTKMVVELWTSKGPFDQLANLLNLVLHPSNGFISS